MTAATNLPQRGGEMATHNNAGEWRQAGISTAATALEVYLQQRCGRYRSLLADIVNANNPQEQQQAIAAARVELRRLPHQQAEPAGE